MLAMILAAVTLGAPVGDLPPPLQIRKHASYAFFEFAPPTGTGMGVVCACATPTGAKGEAMTFTRGSSGTCLKGNTTSGIANGDMVTCTSNQPRVMPGGDGTGGLGLLVEGARTNVALRSEAIDNAAWSKTSTVVAVPTVTADQAVAPDGTTTADRVQFPVVTGVQYSAVSQSAGAGAYAGSIFVKGNASSGAIWLDCHTGSADNCVSCAYVAGSWTRCSCSGGAGTPNLLIGNYPVGCGGVGMAAADVFLWGGQIEASGPTFASSYIATAGAAVTRATEVATLPASLANVTGSMAATFTTPAAVYADGDHAVIGTGTAGPVYKILLDYRGDVPSLTFYGGASGAALAAGLNLSGANRFAGYWTSSASVVSIHNGTPTSGSWGDPIAATTLIEIGTYSGMAPAYAVIKQVCADPSPTRCR